MVSFQHFPGSSGWCWGSCLTCLCLHFSVNKSYLENKLFCQHLCEHYQYHTFALDAHAKWGSPARRRMMSNQGEFKNVHVDIKKAKSGENKLRPWHEKMENENWWPLVELQWSYMLRQTQILGTMIKRLIISLSPVCLDLFQIIMLNSVSDLHGYIDKSQLTRELGGTLEYGHSQWIHHRTVSAAALLAHLHQSCPRDKC